MTGYSPLKITGMATGLVQERENFILPDDAYPVLENAYVWRERILRKKAFQLLGRLRLKLGTTNAGGNFGTIISPNPLNVGYSQFTIGTDTFVDPAGSNPVILLTNGSGVGTLNRSTGVLNIGGSLPNTDVFFYPGLPVMGIRIRELQNSANDQTVFFDQCYAYIYSATSGGFEQFLPGTTWNAHLATISGTDFFFSTNYWTSDVATFGMNTIPGTKLFWVTNNTGAFGPTQDPPRITDGATWVDFFPSAWSQIDGSNFLANFLSMLPYRGRLVVFNTWEGPDVSNLVNYSNRVRWSTIGNPFIAYSAGPPAATGSWRDDIRGQGGFLDIPTSEDIIAVGFVRDNLVIYCERSTWQLRYTGRAIAPFQIERVNSELGAESPFSAVQFDTSLVGIGDKGVVECDSYRSKRIDIKIPDLVFDFNSAQNGVFRVHGVRDFINRLAFWTYPYAPGYDGSIADTSKIFPNRRLCYNYENDSWGIFTDSLTTLGTFQAPTSRRWIDIHIPWIRCDFPWISGTKADPQIVGGNQQGFIEVLDQLTSNDPSLFISDITGNDTTPTVVTSPNHNLTSGTVISFSGIPLGTDFQNLNYNKKGVISGATQADPCVITSIDHRLTDGARIQITDVVGMTQLNNNYYIATVIDDDTFSIGVDSTAYSAYVSGGVWTDQSVNVFGIFVVDDSNFTLFTFDNTSKAFTEPQIDPSSYEYEGGGLISIRDNFSIKSKKFNFLDEGQNIQIGYLDILMASSEPANPGAITLYVYLNYDDVNPSNTPPYNDINDGTILLNPDTFFNSIIPTTQSNLSGVEGTKFWQRVFCATRASFLTLEYTFSNAQMAGIEQENKVQIDAQVLWIRKAGRMTSI